jgi:RNA polymerase-associated protein CTR9
MEVEVLSPDGSKKNGRGIERKEWCEVKAVYCLSKGKVEEALSLFKQLQATEKYNLVAMFGIGRIALLRKQFREALEIYGELLRLVPDGLPDPRLGIGLAKWNLGDWEGARVAWERGVQLVRRDHPG